MNEEIEEVLYVYVRLGNEFVTPNIHIAFRRRTHDNIIAINSNGTSYIAWME